MAAGAAIGTVIAPGAGTAIGGAIGWLVDHLKLSSKNRKRVFVSFDYDNDIKLKNLFVGQARHHKTPFEIVDSSLLEAAPDASWEYYASQAISQSELVVVLLGKQTHRARGVLKEVNMAKRHGVPIVQFVSRRNLNVQTIRGAGRRYLWSWSELEHVLG
ncbi:MAG: TIR domain-containing protein [Polyangiaceae bacterium]|nr:TIR domain-containing protein [Polyangiaceae bacterium]